MKRAPAKAPALCPACNEPVDSLRAGQVAILDGTFRYFCDASCKDAYVDAVSKRPLLDAMTAEPPSVISAGVPTSAPPLAASGVRERSSPSPTPYFPAPEADHDRAFEASQAPPATVDDRGPGLHDDGSRRSQETPDGQGASMSPRADREVVSVVEELAAPFDTASPRTLRSPPSMDSEPASPRRETALRSSVVAAARSAGSHLGALAPVVGGSAGVLAVAVSLAGENATVLRVPLALTSAAIAIARMVRKGRTRSENRAWVVGAPLAVASMFAAVSMAVHHPHADAHASFVGLAGAAALAVDALLARARRDVVQARARTAAALAVTARVVRGAGRVALDPRASSSDARTSPQDVGAEVVEAALVRPGEQVLVEAGETIPVDGVVAAGEAEVAPWLDAPALLQKAEGEPVVAGAVVVSGGLRVNATFSGAERAWLRLAQATSCIELSAPLVGFARKMIDRAAPVAALLVAAAVYADNGSWLDVGIAACAGGYALAATAAAAAGALVHARGHATAQRRGIVYKDATAFDAAARADVAVVCSRGTILLGEPEIVGIEAIAKDGGSTSDLGHTTPRSDMTPSVPADRVDEITDAARVLAIAAGAEISSSHPFAAAILREARGRNVRPDNMRSVLGHSGLGVTALAANGDRVIVGSRAFLLKEKVSVAIADRRTSELEAQGRSVLLVAVGGRLIGLLALQDGLRPGARAAIQRLHDARIEPVLLSGEARDTCETIARALDIEHVRPEILPADRGAEVRALADGGRVVAALGHASTDDGALGAADVSIAMEAAGAAPGEWSVALASDDVRDAALALTVPRACRDCARRVMVAGALTQAAGSLGVAFGVAPPAIVPVLAALAAAAVVSVVRDPGREHTLLPRADERAEL